MHAFATQPSARRFAPFVSGFIFAFIAISQVTQAAGASAQAQHWVAAWAASAQGPYPLGYPAAQPELKSAFPDPARGAVDQSFRLIVRPDIWGNQARIRLSNAFGTQPTPVRPIITRITEDTGVLHFEVQVPRYTHRSPFAI